MDPHNNEQVTYIGKTDFRNQRKKFGIKAKDRLRHVYVIGKTGMGKSTLLENMAAQDIQNGNGISFLDPHGGSAEKLLDYVPEERIEDVVYFAPFDLEYPMSFNVLEDVGADKRHLVANGLMSAFKKIWVDMWSARMEYILNNTLLALLEYPDSTILAVNRMLADGRYRKRVVNNIEDVSVKAFWEDEFAQYGQQYMRQAVAAIQNKIGQFISNPLVRNIIGQPKSQLDFRKLMDSKKIVIINLSKGRMGEDNANLIGSMLITKLYLAAMSRADLSEAEIATLPPFYLYVDEFQSFANDSFADILSEARKYKLSLNIAHQYIEQMTEDVKNAVFGNVGTMITFRVGAFDSMVLENEFSPHFYKEDFVSLGFAQIYLKLMIDGVGSKPFSATTLSPITPPDITYKDEIIKYSRQEYAQPREEVEETIISWHESHAGVVSEEGKKKILKSYKGDGVWVSHDDDSSDGKGSGNKSKQSKSKQSQDKNNKQKNKSNQEKKKSSNQGKTDKSKKTGSSPKSSNNKAKKKKKSKQEESEEREARLQKAISLKQLESKKEEEEKQAKEPSRENVSALRSALSSVLGEALGGGKEEQNKEKVDTTKKKDEDKNKGTKKSDKNQSTKPDKKARNQSEKSKTKSDEAINQEIKQDKEEDEANQKDKVSQSPSSDGSEVISGEKPSSDKTKSTSKNQSPEEVPKSVLDKIFKSD